MMPFKDPNGYYMRNGKLNQLTDGGRAKTHNDNIYLQGQLVIHPLKGWNIYAEAGMRVINQNKQTNLNPIYEHDVNGNPLALAFSGSYSRDLHLHVQHTTIVTFIRQVCTPITHYK